MVSFWEKERGGRKEKADNANFLKLIYIKYIYIYIMLLSLIK